MDGSRRVQIALLVLTMPCALAQPDLSRKIPMATGSGHPTAAAVAVSPKSGPIWVLMNAPDALWRLDGDGRNGRVVPIAVPNGGYMSLEPDILEVTAVGDVYLVGKTDEQPWLIKIAAAGQAVFVRPIDIRGLHAFGLRADPDGTWTVFGENYSGACIARIDENGHKIWMRTFPKEKLASLFLGGVVLRDGSAIAAGNIWDGRAKISMGLASTMLVKVSSQGVTLAEKVFPGRNAALAQTEDGQIILIDDPQSYSAIGEFMTRVAKWPMRMQGWSADLKLLWTATMPAIFAGLLPPEVSAAPGAGVIVFNRGGWPAATLARYDGTGKELWVSHPRGFGTLGGNSGRFVLVQSGPDGAVLTPFGER